MRPSTGAALVAHPVVKHSKRSTTMPVDGQALEQRAVPLSADPATKNLLGEVQPTAPSVQLHERRRRKAVHGEQAPRHRATELRARRKCR
jgi:hypothetical protein